MSKADEIMINCLGRLEVTTTGIYYKQLKQLIDTIEKRNRKDYIIVCQPVIEEYVKQIGRYFKIEFKTSLFLPEDTLIVLADKNIFKPNYERMIKELHWNEKNNKSNRFIK